MRWLVILSLCTGLFLLWLVPVSAQEPVLRVTSPHVGDVIESNTVTVTFEVEAFEIVPSTIPVSEAGQHPEVNRPGEGHLHFILDQQPLVVWYTGEPYAFTQVSAGEHVLMVELADNDHASLSPPVMKMIRFTVSPPPVVMPATGNAPPPRLALLLLVLGATIVLVTMSRRRNSPA
jgi:hypothetical protein